MSRLFVAFELPLHVRAQLCEALPTIAGGRPVKAQLMHVTLRFVGELEPETATQFEAMLEAVRAPVHELGFTKPGTFPALGSGRPATVLFMGLERAPELLKLQAEIDDAAGACGQPREARAFHPHVTVARLKNAPTSQVQRAIAEFEKLKLPRFVVKDFILFESISSDGGTTYHELRRYALSPASSQ